MNTKPLGRKNYGSIGHLPASRMGPADHKITDGQARIATIKPRDKHDVVIVQEKLDGSNVGIARIDNRIVALGRAGYEACTSRFDMHRKFDKWVHQNEDRFSFLADRERLCGEWLIQAHGTRYALPHEPFVAFDLIDSENKRANYNDFVERLDGEFVLPHVISIGAPMSIDTAMMLLGKFGCHGAREPIEGAVWRVERKGIVDYLCKYVRTNKIDGKYLDGPVVMNDYPGGP